MALFWKEAGESTFLYSAIVYEVELPSFSSLSSACKQERRSPSAFLVVSLNVTTETA